MPNVEQKQAIENDVLAEKVRVNFIADHIGRTIQNTCNLCPDVPTDEVRGVMLHILQEWKERQLERLDDILK